MTDFQKKFKNYGDTILYRIDLESSKNLDEDLKFLHEINSSFGNRVLYEYYFKIWKETEVTNQWLSNYIENEVTEYYSSFLTHADYLWQYYCETKQWKKAYRVIHWTNDNRYVKMATENITILLSICEENQGFITLNTEFIAKIIKENSYYPGGPEYQKALERFNRHKIEK